MQPHQRPVANLESALRGAQMQLGEWVAGRPGNRGIPLVWAGEANLGLQAREDAASRILADLVVAVAIHPSERPPELYPEDVGRPAVIPRGPACQQCGEL